MLMRTDPAHDRIYYLSIPRDLYVPIPAYGSDRINAAYQFGRAPLAIRTIQAFTGLNINHIAIVDFNEFKKLIDEIGGIDGRRAACDPLEPFRLPLLRRQVSQPGTAGASQRASST